MNECYNLNKNKVPRKLSLEILTECRLFIITKDLHFRELKKETVFSHRDCILAVISFQ